MSIEEFKEGIEILQDNYSKKYTKEQLILFFENLKDIKRDKYIANIKEHIKRNPYMPNIAQLRGEYTCKDTYAKYDQRDYSNFDFNQLYANKQM